MSSRARKCSCICIFHFASFFHFLLTLLLCTLTLFRAAVGTFYKHTQKDGETERERRGSVKGDVENVAPHYIVNAMTTKCCRLVAWQWAMASKNGAGGSGRDEGQGTGQSASQQNALPGRSKGIFRIH